MNNIQTWGQAITSSLLQLWGRFVNFLPALIGALLVFLIGMMVATIIGKIITKIAQTMRIDQAVERFDSSRQMKKVGISFSLSRIFGEMVKWFLVIVFLMAATDILGLVQVTEFLNKIILYLPNVVVATVILAIAFVLGNISYVLVRGSIRVAGVMSATFLATLSKWAILVFGLLAALIQLGIATSLVNTLFIGFVSALSLAAGLAFGLGGREEAAAVLKKLRENLSENKQ